MNPEEKSLAQRLKEHLESPEGQRSMEEYFNKLAEKARIMEERCQRLKTHFNDDQSFDLIMNRVLDKQRKYDDKHYSTYSERPLHVTNLLWELAASEGEEIGPVDGLTENFPSAIYLYYGYQFAITHGQGSVLSIYKNRECLYRS
jgi:hypothetical protein